jgi:hypothetical protein
MALPTVDAGFLHTTMSDAVNGVSINNRRRIFNFGERISELNPQESPFYVYLSKVAKKTTDDPVFKFLEQRHQWQRRVGSLVGYSNSSGVWTFYVVSKHDVYGRELYTEGAPLTATNVHLTPTYFLPGQQISVKSTDGTMCNFTIHEVSTGAVADSPSTAYANDLTLTTTKLTCHAYTGPTANLYNSKDFSVPLAASTALGASVNIVGSAFLEGSGAPTSWHDELYDREGYCQIFKTAIELHSGTSEATRYRGISNEYMRQWMEKLKEHKMDLEQAFLFQRGGVYDDAAAHADGGFTKKRYTWGILPYTESYGKVYNFSYGGSSHDSFTDAMEDYFAPESGNSGRKLVLASRKIINWMNKLGEGGFLRNTAGSAAYNLDIDKIQGKFGHKIMQVNTIFGELNFVQEPLLRNGYEDYAICIDMNNVAVRPLAANGKNRDTFIKTNIQAPDVDGRQDLITTETGLEISLPETHAILKFS